MKKLVCIISLLVCSYSLIGNNINVTNISLENLDDTNETVIIQFDISWDNSWRIGSGPANWDAAWVFVKFRTNSGAWGHARINVASPGVTGGTVQVTTDEVGAFIYRNAEGSGNVTYSAVQLQWDYGENGVQSIDVIDVQVFAIEMVYVPEGSFSVGGTSTSISGKFYASNSNSSYQITSESSITVAPFGNMYYAGGGDQSGPIPSNFPKGFQGFYCMKYEISEGQWVAFFNTLTPTQKLTNDLTDSDHKNSDGVVDRNTIVWSDEGATQATTSVPDRACGWISQVNLNAYLDWAGLRYMTELEFEKACRGPINPVGGEYAWGNPNIFNSVIYAVINDDLPSEVVGNMGQGIGNALYSTTAMLLNGPVRCGSFAAGATNQTREETGGSYYGIMELSGNISEITISVGSPPGRDYTGVHGDGILTTTGEGNVTLWPSGPGTFAFAVRGGNYQTSAGLLRVSDRLNGSTSLVGISGSRGGRGVRTGL